MADSDDKLTDASTTEVIPLHSTRGHMLGSRPQIDLVGDASRDPIVQFFTSIPLFSLLTAGEVMQLLRVCTIESYQAGDTIFQEGLAADSMIIIERGEVEVTVRGTRGDVTVAHLGDGSVVGEMALIVGGPRTATVSAVTETRVYRLDGREFEILREQRSVAAYKILRKLLETLGDRGENVATRIRDIFARPEESIKQFERYSRELADRISRT